MFLGSCVTMYPKNGLEMYPNQVLAPTFKHELEIKANDAIGNEKLETVPSVSNKSGVDCETINKAYSNNQKSDSAANFGTVAKKKLDSSFDILQPQYILVPFYQHHPAMLPMKINKQQKSTQSPMIAFPQPLIGMNTAIHRYQHPTTPLFIGGSLIYHPSIPASGTSTTIPIVIAKSKNGTYYLLFSIKIIVF